MASNDTRTIFKSQHYQRDISFQLTALIKYTTGSLSFGFFSPSVRVTLEIRISYDFKLVLKEGTDEVKAIKTFLFKRYSFSTRLQNEKITTVDLKVIS